MKKIAILLIVLMMIGVGFLSGCNEQSSNSGYIKIINHNIETKNGIYDNFAYGDYKEVSGTIKNIGDRNVDYAEVTVKFYDSDNELIHTEKTQIQYIAKGETKDFKVTYGETEPYYAQYNHYTVSVWS